MNIDLTNDDAMRLQELLQQRVQELDKEINATDLHRYKEALRESSRQLERILGVISGALEPRVAGPSAWEARDNVSDTEARPR